MTREELMAMAVEKAAREVSLESIEFLFRPSTLFAVLLRNDFDGTVRKFWGAVIDDSPSVIPHRIRHVANGEAVAAGSRLIEIEEFYRAIKAKLSEAAGNADIPGDSAGDCSAGTVCD